MKFKLDLLELGKISYLIENGIAERALTSGSYLLQGLSSLARKYPQLITDRRGIGLLTALGFASDDLVQKFSSACQQRGLLVTPTRNGVVRLILDLLVEYKHIDKALEIMNNSLGTMGFQLAAAS